MSDASDNQSERILFATLLPTARIATALRVPLRRVKQLAELALYEETRRLGLKMKEIQAVLSVGFSKVGTLSREHKDFHATTGPDMGLQRRILLVLWAVPLSEKHLQAAFSDVTPEEVSRTLTEMVADGRLMEEGERTTKYAVATNHNLFVQDALFARISALSSLMVQIFQVIDARFFKRSDEAFVRTLNFRVRERDLPRLEAFYRDVLFPLIQELDEAVDATEPSLPIKLSYLWSRDRDREDEDITHDDGDDDE